MDESRTAWDLVLVQGLRTTLSRLVSPFGSADGLARDFTIILDAPTQFGVVSGPVEAPEELERPHYTLEASVNASGLAIGSMTLRNGETAVINHQLLNADDEVPDGIIPCTVVRSQSVSGVWD